MGTWGANLYQDDIALDVREEYINFLKVGMNNEEATKLLIKIYKDILGYEEYGTFWFALADTQWKYGRLLVQVKKHALELIDSEFKLELWKENEKGYKKRKEVLIELKNRLNTEQPKEKKISKLVLKKANWETGDIILYQILNEKLKMHKWYKKYILLNVVGKNRTNIGNLPEEIYYNEQSIISLYNWIGSEVPKEEIIKKLNFLTLQDYNDALFGNRKEISGIIHFTKGELKKLNIKVIDKEKNNKEKDKQRYSTKTWYNIHNFDYAIINALEKAERDGILIDEC